MMGLALTALKGIAGLFGVSPFLIGAVTAGVIALGAGGGALVWHHKVYQSGYNAALADIAEENDEAIARAVAKRNVWKDCRSRGGTWDQTSGTCS